MTAPRPHRLRTAFVHLALGASGVVVGLIIAEIGLRALSLPWLETLVHRQASPLGWLPPDWEAGWRGAVRPHPMLGIEHAARVDMAVPRPGHPGGFFRFRTNNLGLRRDLDTSVAKPAGTFRVLVLGDSHTDGYVDNGESFATLLESGLQARLAPARRAEVLNAGVLTYSPAQELLWYRLHGVALEPDLVLFVFYPGNDAVDLLGPGPSVDPASGQAVPPRVAAPSTTSGAGWPRSRLVALLWHAVDAGPLAAPWRRLGLPRPSVEGHGYPVATLVEVFRLCEGCYWQSLFQAARVRQDPLEMQKAVRRAAELAVRLDTEVRALGARLVAVVLPSRPQVEPERADADHRRKIAGLLGLDESSLSFDDEVARAVTSRLLDAGVPAVSLREPLLRAARTGGPLYYDTDWHLNPRGHRIVAATLERELVERGFLPAPQPSGVRAGRKTAVAVPAQARR